MAGQPQQDLFSSMFSQDKNDRISTVSYFQRVTTRSMPNFWRDEHGKTPLTMQMMWVVAHPHHCVVEGNNVNFMFVPEGLELDLLALVGWLIGAIQKQPIISEWYPHLANIIAPNIGCWYVTRCG